MPASNSPIIVIVATAVALLASPSTGITPSQASLVESNAIAGTLTARGEPDIRMIQHVAANALDVNIFSFLFLETSEPAGFTVDSERGSVVFDLSAFASELVDGLEPLGMSDRRLILALLGPEEHIALNERTANEGSNPAPSQAVPNGNNHDVDYNLRGPVLESALEVELETILGVSDGSAFEGALAPEWKTMYRATSSEIDSDAPWLKPTVKAIDAAASSGSPPNASSTSPWGESITSDDIWILNHLLSLQRFVFSGDFVPFVVIILVCYAVFLGLRRLVRMHDVQRASAEHHWPSERRERRRHPRRRPRSRAAAGSSDVAR